MLGSALVQKITDGRDSCRPVLFDPQVYGMFCWCGRILMNEKKESVHLTINQSVFLFYGKTIVKRVLFHFVVHMTLLLSGIRCHAAQ